MGIHGARLDILEKSDDVYCIVSVSRRLVCPYAFHVLLCTIIALRKFTISPAALADGCLYSLSCERLF